MVRREWTKPSSPESAWQPGHGSSQNVNTLVSCILNCLADTIKSACPQRISALFATHLENGSQTQISNRNVGLHFMFIYLIIFFMNRLVLVLVQYSIYHSWTVSRFFVIERPTTVTTILGFALTPYTSSHTLAPAEPPDTGQPHATLLHLIISSETITTEV